MVQEGLGGSRKVQEGLEVWHGPGGSWRIRESPRGSRRIWKSWGGPGRVLEGPGGSGGLAGSGNFPDPFRTLQTY